MTWRRMWMQRAKSPWHIQYFHRSSKSPGLFVSLCSCSEVPVKKSKATPLQETRMRDRFTIYAKGGNGGSGCCSFRHSRHLRHGKPDGGNGGRGGDVILECSPSVWDFRGLQHHLKAGRGGNGTPKNKIGTRGEDKVVLVPVGTVIHLIKGEIPSVVDNRSETDLDPWERSGSLVDDVSESDQQSTIVKQRPGSLADDVSESDQKSTILKQRPGSFDYVSQSDRQATIQNRSVPEDVKTLCNTDCSSTKTEILVKESANLQHGTEADQEGEEQIQYKVAELTKQGQQVVIASGGEGGLGNVCCPSLFRKPTVMKSKSSSDRKVAKDDQSSISAGVPGSETELILELKSIADVGLVGMPSAGKSTLLGAISRAKPAVGHYAFTTLRPNLGNMNFDDIQITVADIPGLIKGAHENRGLGHAFLRHIERTKVLAYVVDLASGLDGRKGIKPWEQLKDLILELEHHQEGLSDRPSLVVANKIDEDGAEDVYEELGKRVQNIPIYPVCAVLEEGISELKVGLRMLVNGEKTERLSLDKINVD